MKITLFLLTTLVFLSASCAAQLVNEKKSHHTDKGFRNIYVEDDHGFSDFTKWRWDRVWKNIPGYDEYSFPAADYDAEFVRNNREVTTVTWVGHATVLLQIDGMNILTDPQFSERASPVQWAGPRRVIPPVPPLQELPLIDIVIISHDHYDSLDTGSIRALHQREGGENTVFFVPLALKEWFHKRGISRVIELDWWEEFETGSLKIIATPLQHWGKRSPFSRNEHLWAGWVVLSKDFRFYFGGDSGYCPHFGETGEKYGPFDLSVIPIGAYEPRWFMRNHHINPEEAVQVHYDLRSKKSVAMHWGTFILTDEPLDEPPVRLRKELKKRGAAENEFLILKHGETIFP